MSDPESLDTRETRASLRFGWSLLFVGALGGVLLETLHGFKAAPYLDDHLTRLLLTLSHAHAVGLALVVLAHAAVGAPLLTRRWPGHALRISAVLVPLGFALGAIAHPEGDPNVAILLVPLGAVFLLAGLGGITRAAFRA